jgi:molecular chaperone DnaK
MTVAPVVGIDLGTTFSAIAVVNRHGFPEVLANRDGEDITPSVVLFDRGSAVVGSSARRGATATPLDVVQFVKRQMGVPHWTFITGAGERYSAEEVSALILKRLKEDAEAKLGVAIHDAVITVPAYFDDAQRKATQQAGQIAGLNVLRIINEPTAAALAYGIDKAREPQTLLVYDLGGGTFDVTVMRIDAGNIDVIATGGDKNLGGFDWDNLLMMHLNEKFMAAGGPDLFGDPATEQDLRDKAEICKKNLSNLDRTSMHFQAGGRSVGIEVTLETFEELSRPLNERTARIVGLVLDDANLRPEQIDKVLLVGGSTRMRAVPAIIQTIFGRTGSRELDPDKVVAQGAALQGALLAAQSGRPSWVDPGAVPPVEIRDVNSHSLGVVTLDDQGKLYNSVVLRKDSPYGTREEDTFCTVVDGQKSIRLRVTEGEGRDLEGLSIVFEHEVPVPSYPAGAPIRIGFLYTHDGTVRIEVYDLTARRPLTDDLKFERKSNKSDQQVDDSKQRFSTHPIE